MDQLPKRTRMTGSSRDKAAKALEKQYSAGSSIRHLANETGRSYGWVHRVLAEQGVEFRGRGGARRKSRTQRS